MVDVNQVVRETLALRAYEQRVTNITVIDALAAGPAAGVRRRPSGAAGAAESRHQRRAGDARRRNGRGMLVVRTWHDADQESVVLEINDDGPGIPDELQPKIFDPFFTTKEVGKGTGSRADGGVRDRAGARRAHPARIAAGTGASFYVELPVTGAQAAAGAADAPELPTSTGGCRARPILVVEDEAALAQRGGRRAARRRLPGRARRGRRRGAGHGQGAGIRPGHLRSEDAARSTARRSIGTLAADAPELAKRVIFVTGDVAGTDAEEFLRRAGAAGWRSRSASEICCAR